MTQQLSRLPVISHAKRRKKLPCYTARYIIVGAEYDLRTEVAHFGKTARYIMNHANCDFIVCQNSNLDEKG